LKAVALRRKSNGAAHFPMILDPPSGFGVSSRQIKTGCPEYWVKIC
jgi:hypothetical protein